MQKYYNKKRKLNKLKRSLLLLMMVCFAGVATAQQQNMTNGTYELTSAGVSFYDSGGPGSGGSTRYQHNEEYTFVFTLPSNQASAGLKVEFSSLRVNDDHLYIYEGTTVDESKLIADFTCNDYYYTFADLCASGNITVISHGAMTFRFESNEQYRDNGWAATINIVEQDQIVSNVPAPVIAMQACQNVVELIPTMLTTEEEGNLQLFYSTDGTNFSEYSAPFNVSNGATVTAYAKLGNAQSGDHSVIINRAPIAAPTLTRVNEDENNLLKVTRPTVPTGANDTYKVRYTLDGSDPTTSSTAQTIEWTHHSGQTDVNDMIIDISDAVFLTPTGNFQVKAVTQGTTCPNIMSAVVTYETDKLFAATPVITLTGTTQTGNINITCSTTGATIYYTVDGSTPVAGATNTYVWGATGAPTTIAAGGTVRAFAAASNREDSPVVSEIYVPGGTSGGSSVYGSTVLLDDREDHTWSYYSDNTNPIRSLKPADVKITYKGYGENTMTSTSTADMPANSAFDTDVAENQVAVNKNEAGNQFIYLKTLEAANEAGSGNYPYTMIANPFQVRPKGTSGTVTPDTRNIYITYYRASRYNGGELEVTYYDVDNERQTETFTINSSTQTHVTRTVKASTSVTFRLRGTGTSPRVAFDAQYDDANGTTFATSGEYWYTSTSWTSYGPFTIPTGSSITVPEWRGFYAWRVKSLSNGLSIKVGNTTYTSANIANGIIIYPEQEIEFVTANTKGNEVEFEALWAQAYVNSNTYVSNSGNYKNAYERNFKVGTSVDTYDYPVTFSTINPDGSGSAGTVTLGGNYTCSNDVKFENMTFGGTTTRTITAAGHNLALGRGISGRTNNIQGISGNSENLDYTLRVESGTFNNFTIMNRGTATCTGVNSGRAILGSDYDRAKNDNGKLSITGEMYGGSGNHAFSSEANRNNLTFDWLIKSGYFQGNVGTATAEQSIYFGTPISGNNGVQYQGRRRLTIEGGSIANIAGGVNNSGNNYSNYAVNDGSWTVMVRMKGGTVRGVIYGAAQYAGSSGDRRFVFTGGNVAGWIAGGCNGTNTDGGELYGDTYIYFGGKAKCDSNGSSTTIGPGQATGGNIFGAGSGNSGATGDDATVGRVNNSTIVIADEASVERNVYGGGNYGYVRNGETNKSDIYVLGGTVEGSVFGGSNMQKGQNVNITMKDGTVEGNLYGGSNTQGTINYLATINMSGGTVNNVYGGGFGSSTSMAKGTVVTVSGGTVNNNVYGGGEQGNVASVGTTVTISGNATVNDVYGAGKGTQGTNVPFTSANIAGPTSVTIADEAHVCGTVYGGGENGSVGYANANAPATGSTVNIKGGVIDNNVFGGGSKGVTNGNVVVNITWDNDEMAKTQIKGSVYGGALGTREKVYVKGTKTVNMNNGIVGNSLYGGSRNADDALDWNPTASGQTTTSNVVNISGGEVTYQVFAAGYFGHTYGSAYAFIGEHAINTALEKAPTTGFNYDINPLRIRASVWAGADFGSFDGTKFGDPTVEGKTYVYIDGTGYNTITDHPQVKGYMNIEGSVYGCGTSCDAGKTDTKVVVRNYGQPVATSTRSIVEPYQTATRSLYSIQRAETIILDNAHINYLGQGRVNSLVTTEKYAIHNAEKGLYVVNGSSVMINRPIDEIKKLMNGTINDVYAASFAFTPENLSEQGTISVDNKYRVYGGTYINVFYTTETENGTEEKYGELSGFAYMMTDAYDSEDNTKTCAYARPKWGQGAPFSQGSSDYDNPNDGGFISYNAGWNEFDANGENSVNGVQMTYENHVYGSKNGEDYFRIWRYGGLYSYREGVLIAESNGEEDTYNICSTDIELPATEVGGYYRVQVKQGTSNSTSINYGTDVETCNAAYYGDTYNTTSNNWMSAGTNAFQTGQSMSAVSEGLTCITSYDNVNFGLVAIPQGAMAPAGNVNNGNWIINEDADALLANANTKWTYSDNTEMPIVHFQLTYSNGINVNKVLDPVTIYFEQYGPVYEDDDDDPETPAVITGYQLTDVVEVALIITTKTTINQPVTTRVVALMQGKGDVGDVYSGRVTLPSYPVFMNTNGDPSAWTLQSLTWTDEVNGQHTGASMVPYSENNPTFEGSDTKFSMLFYAATNKDYTWGWDDYNYGPFDVTDNNINKLIGKTMGRKDFTINFDLYYDGELTSTTQKMGELTFTFQYTHHNVGTNDQPVDETSTCTITIEVWRKGPGTNYYLDGVNGKNSYAGTRPDAAKLTLNAILSRTDYMAGDNIFIVNTVTQKDATKLSWDGSAYDNITIYRYPGGHPMAFGDEEWQSGYYADYNHDNPCFPGVMVDVKSEMEMQFITLNGFSEEINSTHPVGGNLAESFVEAFAATAPMVRVENGGKLNLANGTLLTCNDNTSTDGGAVKVDAGGTLSMFNSSITGNATANTGGAVYMAGNMNISGKVDLTGNVKGNKQNNVFLSEYVKVVTMTGEVDPESRIGITKDDWKLNNVTKWYNPVVYSDDASRLDVFYTDEDLGRMTDDKGMYQLNKLSLSPSEFQNSSKYLFFVGTWVTAVTFNPYFESREAAGYTDLFTAAQLADIHTPQQLAWAISLATGYNKVNNGAGYPDTDFTLTADIDMDDNIWVPIGNDQVKYTGTFNGNGHVVTGIRSPLDASDKGMFGVITGNASIENMIVSTDFSDGNSTNLGGLVGLMENGTIANCEAAGSVTGNDNTQNLGGVAAKVVAGTIHSVFAVSTLTGGENTVVGGLVGTNGGDLYNSYANVTFGEGMNNTGGLVGVNTGTVENCYNASTATYAFAAQNQVTVGEGDAAVTTKGNINYCYAASGVTSLVGGEASAQGNLTGNGNYGTVQPDIKHLEYMFYDNLIAANTNTYVGGAGVTGYVNNHTPIWNGLLSALNQWVRTKNGNTPTYSLWNRPINNKVNGDLPVLAFPKDNSMATLNSDGKYLQYSTGLDNLLDAYKADAGVFVYGAVTGVAKVPAANTVKVTINEDAVLLQAADAGDFTATVGVTFDNSKKTATDFYNQQTGYDWHFFSSPLAAAPMGITYNSEAEIGYGKPANISGMTGNYLPNGLTSQTGDDQVKWDLYSFYEPEYHWINFKRSANNHWHYDEPHRNIAYNQETTFTPGKGYMMAISKDSYLNNSGTLNKTDFDVNLTYASHAPGIEELGYNLVGNPYMAYLNMDAFAAVNSNFGSYWVYIAENDNYVPGNSLASNNPALPSVTLHPHQAFFVKATESNQKVSFKYDMATASPNPDSYYRGTQVNYPLVNLFATNTDGKKDLAVVEFNRPDKGGSEKLYALNNANFNLSAAQDGSEYSILFTEEGTERVPVHFSTSQDGTFELTWETMHGNFTSLLLVDNKTGVITDMLRADHYTFDATTDDYASRFYITYRVTTVDEYNEGDGTFAFFDGSEWIIEGKGMLDVVDVMGRTLYSERLVNDKNRVSLNGVAAGVYLLRVSDGTNTMVQKIVVK